MRDQILSDDFLTCYLTMAEDDFLATLPDEQDLQVRFSERFRRRMQKLVARTKQPTRGKATRLNRRVALLVAALLLLLLIAAGYYSVSDAFRGVLTEQTQTGETVPIASLSPLVDKAGVLPMQTVSANKIDVTLRAAVFTELGCKLLVDVKTTDGSPLAAPLSERSEYQRSLQFRETLLTYEGQKRSHGMRMSSAELGEDYTDDKATLLFEGDGLPPEARGKTATLTMKNLMQCAWFKTGGTPSAPGELSLKDLADALPPPDMSRFEKDEVTRRDGSFARYQYDRIGEPQKQGILFSKLFPNSYIDTIFVEGESIQLLGVSSNYEELQYTNGLMLKNMVTGEVMRKGFSGGSSRKKDQEYSEWNMRLDGVKDLANLQNFTIIRPATGRSILTLDGKGNGESAPSAADPMLDLLDAQMLGVSAGEWAVSFPLDYEATERVVQTEVPITFQTRKCKVTQVMLSPFYILLELEDIDEKPPADPAEQRGRDHEPIVVTATRRDGAALKLPDEGGTSGGDGNSRTVYIDIDTVIDPNEIATITLNGVAIPLDVK